MRYKISSRMFEWFSCRMNSHKISPPCQTSLVDHHVISPLESRLYTRRTLNTLPTYSSPTLVNLSLRSFPKLPPARSFYNPRHDHIR